MSSDHSQSYPVTMRHEAAGFGAASMCSASSKRRGEGQRVLLIYIECEEGAQYTIVAAKTNIQNEGQYKEEGLYDTVIWIKHSDP